MKKYLVALWLATLASGGVAQAQEPVLIGRVAHIEGGVLRYVTVEDDWVDTVADSPLRADDIIYTEPEGRAEFIFPNNTWVRVDGNTGVDVIALRRDLTGIYVDGGVVRIYNRSQEALVRVETRWGYLAAEPGDVVDVYVGDKDIQVIALEGSPNFFYTRAGREVRYEVLADGPAIFVDEMSVEAAEPLVDRDWESWNYKRDQLLAERRRVRSAHLPEAFQYDAHVFETQGRWERVYYREKYVWCWTPIHVDVSWRPFTVGRWTTYYEENVWVPYEPWGWVTHHYGHWIQVENRWWWTPYVSVNVVSPGVDVRVDVGVPPPPDYYWYWHPGRVAWIHSEVHVGWFPLAPWEPYYGWYPWYGNTVVVNNTNITNININISNYNYFGNAVIVNYNNFYNVPYGNNYIQHNVVNITNINKTTIINNYYAAPVIHKTVIKNQNFFKNQYNFSDRHVAYKPHHSVVEKASFAKNDFHKHGFGSASEYHAKRDKTIKADPVLGDAHKRAKGLSAANKLVKPEDVKRPANQMKFGSREPKLQAEKPKLHDAEKQSSKQIKEASSRKGLAGEGRTERLGKGGVQEGPGKLRDERLRPTTKDSSQGRSSRDRDMQVQGEGRKGTLDDSGGRVGRRLRPEGEGTRGELKTGSKEGRLGTRGQAGQEQAEGKLPHRPGSTERPERGLKGVDRSVGGTQVEDRAGQGKRETEKGTRTRGLGRQEENQGQSQSLQEKSRRSRPQEGLAGEPQGSAKGLQKPGDKPRMTGQEQRGQTDRPKMSTREMEQAGQEKRSGQGRKQLQEQGSLQQGSHRQQQQDQQQEKIRQQQEKQKQQQHQSQQKQQSKQQPPQQQKVQQQQQQQHKQMQQHVPQGQQGPLPTQEKQKQQQHQSQQKPQQLGQQNQQQQKLLQQQQEQQRRQQQQQHQSKQQPPQQQKIQQQQHKQMQQHAPQGQQGPLPNQDQQNKGKKKLQPGEQPQ